MRIRNLINENRARKILVTMILVTVTALIVGPPNLGYVSAKKYGGGALRGHADKRSPDSLERSLSKTVGSRASDPTRALDDGALDEQRAAALKKLAVKH